MLLADEALTTRVVLTEGRATPARPDRASQTIHRIVAGNLAALLLVILSGYVAGARLAERQALTDASRFTHTIGETVVGPHVTARLAAGDPAAVRRLDRIFRDRLLRTTSIARIKVWAPDGTVLYSDDHGEIGQTFALSPSKRALLGTTGTIAEVSALEGDENVADRTLGSRLVEVYTGVTADDGSPALFEAYLGYDEVRARRTDLFTTLALLAGALTAVFAAAQVSVGHLNLRWLRRRQADLERLSTEVTDRERRRVARDLHDGAVQELVGLSFLVDGAAACVRRGDLERADETLSRCAASVQSSVQSLRTTIVEVYPHVLEDRGLGPALEDLVQPLRSRGVRVLVRCDIDQPLPHPTVAAAYRAAQEAVRNVSRHARATEVVLDVRATAERLRLTVSDDGVGFDPSQLSRRGTVAGHLGLQALTDTALELGGRLEVATAPGRGTEVIWEVPR